MLQSQFVRALLISCILCAIAPAAASADPNAVSLSNNAQISGNVFAESNGVLRLNVASGTGNQQLNAALLGINAPLADAVLATQTAQKTSAPTVVPRMASGARVAIGSGVFAHSSGLAQLNETAGTANASANVFTLNIHP